MARSFKKTPIFGTTKADSEKQDKQMAHRRVRAHFRTALGSAQDLEEFQFEEAQKAHSNIWDHAKDGRRFEQDLRVKHEQRALVVLNKPWWADTTRQVHKALGK